MVGGICQVKPNGWSSLYSWCGVLKYRCARHTHMQMYLVPPNLSFSLPDRLIKTSCNNNNKLWWSGKEIYERLKSLIPRSWKESKDSNYALRIPSLVARGKRSFLFCCWIWTSPVLNCRTLLVIYQEMISCRLNWARLASLENDLCPSPGIPLSIIHNYAYELAWLGYWKEKSVTLTGQGRACWESHTNAWLLSPFTIIPRDVVTRGKARTVLDV